MSGQELHWEQPELAWLLAVLVVIGVGIGLHFYWKKVVIRRLGDSPLVHRMLASVSHGAQWVRWLMLLGATALIIVGLLRPQYGTREAELANRGIDIVIALDLSKSMLVKDVAPDRLRASIGELNAVMDKLSGGRIGLVPFAGTAFTQTPLTTDFDAVRSYLSDLRVEDMPVGGTKIGHAIRHALTVFPKPEEDADDPDLDDLEQPASSHNKAIILISDGDDHDEDAIEAAQAAAATNVRVYTIGIGSQSSTAKIPVVSEEGSRVGWVNSKDGAPVFSDLNTGLLRDIATASNGDFYVYGRDDVASSLSSALDALEKAEYIHHYRNLREDRYQFVLIPALLLLLGESLISDRRRRRKRRKYTE
jgi:Ca-activated chloride channel family protein